jgi:hypothetical protein
MSNGIDNNKHSFEKNRRFMHTTNVLNFDIGTNITTILQLMHELMI